MWKSKHIICLCVHALNLFIESEGLNVIYVHLKGLPCPQFLCEYISGYLFHFWHFITLLHPTYTRILLYRLKSHSWKKWTATVPAYHFVKCQGCAHAQVGCLSNLSPQVIDVAASLLPAKSWCTHNYLCRIRTRAIFLLCNLHLLPMVAVTHPIVLHGSVVCNQRHDSLNLWI